MMRAMSTPIATTAILLLLSFSICWKETGAEGTNLGEGIITQTTVDVYADLSLDIQNVQSSSSSSAINIYLYGKNANNPSGGKLSLQSLSANLANLDPQNVGPNYLYQLYGLSGRETDLSKVTSQAHYADNYVQALISKSDRLASTAMMVLNMWMYGTYLLYHGVDTCQKRLTADNPDLFTLGGGGIDEFIALWIGRNQTVGSDLSLPHSLSALANDAADLFETSVSEAHVNTQLKLLYKQGASILTKSDSCVSSSGETDAAQELWTVVQRMISQMTVPLVQMLIDSILQSRVEETQLYAMAIVPQISSCRPSIFKRLNDELLSTAGSVNFAKANDMIQDLQQVFPCLGITCEDVGAYLVTRLPQCTDPGTKTPLAEYALSTNTHPLASIDLDILQLKILTSLGAYASAKYLYMFGRNSPKVVTIASTNQSSVQFSSLQYFATSTVRQSAGSLHDAFVSYFNDPNYANTTISNTLDGLGKWGSAPADVRAAIVGTTAAFQIAYMYAWAELALAQQECQRGKALTSDGSVNSWDEVAALYIGSLEGPSAGGSVDQEDGQLFWNLANQRAFQFQTVADGGFSQADSKMENLLFAGKGALDAKDCANLGKTVNQIKFWAVVPIIQSALRYAIQNAGKTASLQDSGFAFGEAFTLAVLPMLAQYDQSSAQVIAENMVVQEGDTLVQSGPQEVANAFATVAVSSLHIQCSDLGYTSQVNPCQNFGQSGSPTMRLLTSSNYAVLVGTVVSLISWLML